MRTYPAEARAPESAAGGLYSESVRFPAYLLSKSGEVIRPAVVELSGDDLPAGEVLIRVEWTAINFKDAMVTRPGNRVARKFPLVPGVELTGVVEESSSPEFSAGQRVLVQGYDLGVAHHGVVAADARVPADWVVPLPDRLSCRSAAIIGLAGLTALLSLRRLRQHGTTTDDGPILVTGASGGVGFTNRALKLGVRLIQFFGEGLRLLALLLQLFGESVRLPGLFLELQRSRLQLIRGCDSFGPRSFGAQQ